jgi:hypothetical protein
MNSLLSSFTAFVCALALCAGATLANATDKKTQLTAAFLFQFTRYVEWPKLPSNKFKIAIVGSPETVSILNKLIEGKTVGKGPQKVPLETVPVKTIPTTLSAYQVIFIPEEFAQDLTETEKSARQSHCLVVTTGSGLATRGSHISIFEEGDHLRFEANRTAAQAAGLNLGAQLLRLAILVGQ